MAVKLDASREDVKALAKQTTDGARSGYLLAWSTPPSAEFVLDADTAVRYKLVKTSDGLLFTPRPGLSVIIR